VYFERLAELEKRGERIRIALIGAGSMGVGIAWQIGRTPGMELVSITDIHPEAALQAARAYGKPHALVTSKDPFPPQNSIAVTTDPFLLFEDRPGFRPDVLVEATNTIGFASRVCLAAIRRKIHVVLMNAEVDLALGILLHREAEKHGVVVTSDAGDQHGVLMRMIDEIRMWGFEIAMAGNIKGFLDRTSTAESKREEARIRNLNPVQCAAYSDGTKLNIEMALIGNGAGLVPWVTGMEGPAAGDVREVFSRFDFSRYGRTGVVDYILGAEPNGGVFVVGRCDDPVQVPYLKYYKLGEGPFYLFYRPYHLCHLETPVAVAAAALDRRPILWPRHGRLNDVYAFAKRDLKAGEAIAHGIGGDSCYGLIEKCADADAKGRLPIALLEREDDSMPRMTRAVPKDRPLTYQDADLPDTTLLRKFREQEKIIRDGFRPADG
jgi:predicted homoserine dehydrogenase-like protein